VGEFLKALYNTKTLGLGWAIWWRTALVVLAHFVVIFILSMLIQNLGAAILGIFNLIVSILMLFVSFMALGWAVVRIKDKL